MSACDAFTGPEGHTIAGRRPQFGEAQLAAYDLAPDSRTVYYLMVDPTGHPGSAVRSVDVVTGEFKTIVQTLRGSRGMAQYVHAPLNSPDVFVSITQDIGCTPGNLWRIPRDGGPPDSVLSDVANAAFVVSPNGSQVAFVARRKLNPATLSCPGGDSLIVRHVTGDRAGQQRTVERDVAGSGATPVALSDAGDLLYFAFAPGLQSSTLLLSGANGSVPREILRRPIGAPGVISPDVRWSGSTPLILLATPAGDSTAIRELNGDTGEQIALGSIPSAGRILEGPARSGDGTAWAAWVVVEELPSNNVERQRRRYRLYVGGRDTETRSIAELVSDQAPFRLDISPDGKSITFVQNYAFYLLPSEF
jgi:hypothetical protein